MSKMEQFNRILPQTLEFEGGLTADHAGLTNYGVTQPAYDAYLKSQKRPSQSVKEITYGEVKDLYYRDFYQKPKISQLPEKLSGAVFDYAVNSGPKKAVMDLQKIVGSDADGVIGPKTLAAVKEYIGKNGEDALIGNLIDTRESYLQDLIDSNPQKYGRFANGWGNRLNKLRDSYGL